MLTIMIAVQLSRGPGFAPSIIGVSRCDILDVVLLVILVIASIILTLIGVKVNQNEYERKESCEGYEFVKGDVKYTNKNTKALILIGLIAAFLSTTVGLGPAVAIQPMLVQLDLNAATASATGMYLTMFTAGCATITMIVFQRLDLQYTLIINIITILGTLPGVYGQGWIVRKAGGRFQFTIMIMMFFQVFAVATIFPMMLKNSFSARDYGEDIFAFSTYCTPT